MQLIEATTANKDFFKLYTFMIIVHYFLYAKILINIYKI